MNSRILRSCLFLVLAAIGCSSSEDAGQQDDDASFAVDRTEIVRGVPDRDRDPSVVAIKIADEGLCSGSLVGSNVVLTARHCVSKTTEEVGCPSKSKQISGNRQADQLAIYAGEDIAHATLLGKGKELVVPKSEEICDQDIAFILLDRDVKGVKPLLLSEAPVVKGERVRAIGFGKRGDKASPGVKLLRDNVRVLETSPAEFLVGEATCQGDSGGPALDAKTGEIIGVVSRGGPKCDAKDAHNVYSRVDAHRELVVEATHRGAKFAEARGEDGGRGIMQPLDDLGEACQIADECSTGICAKHGHASYCSRECDDQDNVCPTGYSCRPTPGGFSACAHDSHKHAGHKGKGHKGKGHKGERDAGADLEE